jgi:hypothetical protein
MKRSGDNMGPQQPAHSLSFLVEALNELRDSLAMLSTDLKDYLADIPSPERDEAILQFELHMARIRISNRDGMK